MLTAALPLHILSQLSMMPTPRGESSRLAERLPHWQGALSQCRPQNLTQRAYRRWRLLYTYWLNSQETLLQHGLRRKHFDAQTAEQLKALTAALLPPEESLCEAALEPRLWACFITPFAWAESVGVAHPITVRRVAGEARIPPFHLSARIQEAAMTAAGNLAIEALSQALGKRLRLGRSYPLSVDAAFPDDVRFTDESASLAFALAALKTLCDIERPGLAASGIVLRDSGEIQRVQGFDLPYGKLEACFDAGIRELLLPWDTPIHDMPKLGICLEQTGEGRFRYYFKDAPQDDMRIYWLRNLDDAVACLWAGQERRMHEQLRGQIAVKQDLSFRSWEPLFLRIEQDYPEWLAVPFKIYFQYFRDLSELPPNDPQDWQDILRLQANWVQLWLRYLLNLQASGLWLGRQNPAAIWPSFPACCLADGDPYLLWQAYQEICALETRGPTPFKQMHQWLQTHQTGWGMLLNQLIQLGAETDVRRLREGLHYNMLRLMELLKSATFMFEYQLYGLFHLQTEQVIGLHYRGFTAQVPIVGETPVGGGGLFLERLRTKTRYRLPFLQLCPDCLELEHTTPLVWSGREGEQLQYSGCEHAPIWIRENQADGPKQTSAYNRAPSAEKAPPPEPLQLAKRPQAAETPVTDQEAAMACVVHTELLLNALTTLQDPQQTLTIYERMVRQLIKWLGLDPKDPRQLLVHYSIEANTLIFFGWPEQALNFALALHQLVSDYNQRQNLPSAHIQVRTGLSLGAVLGIYDKSRKSRAIGPAVQEAQALAKWGKPGHLLASASCRDALQRVSLAHRKLFHAVGAPATDSAARIYTVYTQNTGLRELPVGFRARSDVTLEPSRLDTHHLIERQVSLRWFGVLMVEIIGLQEQGLQKQQDWLQELSERLAMAMHRVLRLDEPLLLDLSDGYLLVCEQRLQNTLLLALELYRLLGAEPVAWEPRCAVHVGLGEIRSALNEALMLYGPVRESIGRILSSAESAQLVTDQWSCAFFRTLEPALAQAFVDWCPCPGEAELPLLSYHDSALGLIAPAARIAAPQPEKPQIPTPPSEAPARKSPPSPLPTIKEPGKSVPAHLAAYQHYAASHPQPAARGSSAGPGKRPQTLQNHLGMMFQLIEAGYYMMGSPQTEVGREADETHHLVVISRPFYIQTTQVTQKQWMPVMGKNVSHYLHPDLPVDSATWYDIQAYLTQLNRMGKERYRQPTEAEWEYCCRAGTTTAYCCGNQPAKLGDYAWFGENAAEGYAKGKTHRVATRLPNRWGLYDMHGNVWEWVADWYSGLPAEEQTNPVGPAKGKVKVIKGGRWASAAGSCRSASRSYLPPNETNPGGVGFRLVLEAL